MGYQTQIIRGNVLSVVSGDKKKNTYYIYYSFGWNMKMLSCCIVVRNGQDASVTKDGQPISTRITATRLVTTVVGVDRRMQKGNGRNGRMCCLCLEQLTYHLDISCKKQIGKKRNLTKH